MEEKKKMRFRINLLDIVLILLAILCVVGVFQRRNIEKLFESGEAMESYSIRFEIRKMRSSTVELLQADTALYLEEDGRRVSLGTIAEAPSVSASVVYLPDGEGGTVEAVYPEDAYEYLQDVKGTLLCRGVVHDGSFRLEGSTYLAVNQTVKAYTENADFEIRILAIEKNA